MFHSCNAEPDQLLHQPCPINMRGDWYFKLFCRIEDCLEFTVAHLYIVRIVVWRGKTACRHYFNKISAYLLLSADSGLEKIGSVSRADTGAFQKIA